MSAANSKPTYIYIVQADIPAEHEDEFNKLYDGEHVGFIRQVRGLVGCERYRLQKASEDDMPRYLFVYEIETPELLDSPEWRNAVDAGAWKDTIRPHMYNMRKSVFRKWMPEVSF